jgi:non-heme chloroperoxidase
VVHAFRDGAGIAACEHRNGGASCGGSAPRRRRYRNAGTPIDVFNGFRAGFAADRSQLLYDTAIPFFGGNRPGATVSKGILDSFWLQGMQGGFIGLYECIKAFSETNFTDDLKKIDGPALVLHGDDDQIVPIGDAGLLSAKLIPGAQLTVYAGAPHGMPITLADRINTDLLAFIATIAA